MRYIYADNAATTKMSETALRVMTECMEEYYGNPSSLHAEGQRAAAKLVRQDGIGTRAQQALAAGREAMKTERQRQSRAQKAAETERQFALRQQKRKEKHKGH